MEGLLHGKRKAGIDPAGAYKFLALLWCDGALDATQAFVDECANRFAPDVYFKILEDSAKPEDFNINTIYVVLLKLSQL